MRGAEEQMGLARLGVGKTLPRGKLRRVESISEQMHIRKRTSLTFLVKKSIQ